MKDELIKKVKSKDEDSVKTLLMTYRYLVAKIVNGFYINRGDYKIDRNDLLQEGDIALYHAALTYKEESEASFATYAYKVIYRRLCRAIEKLGGHYRFEGLSIDTDNHAELVSEHFYDDPKKMIIYYDTLKAMQTFMKGSSPLEKEIIRMRQDKNSYKAIADSLNITPKRVDYLIQRMKNRYQKISNGGY